MGSFWGQLGGFYRDPANHFSGCRLNWRCPLKFRGPSRDPSVVPLAGFVGGTVNRIGDSDMKTAFNVWV